MKAAITAVAGYVPEDLLTNADLERMVETTDEWIKSRTGIETRHILKDPALATSDMGAEAEVDGLEVVLEDLRLVVWLGGGLVWWCVLRSSGEWASIWVHVRKPLSQLLPPLPPAHTNRRVNHPTLRRRRRRTLVK